MPAKLPKRTTNVFKVTGNFIKRKKTQKFTKEVIVNNKDQAKEYIFSIMGSKHRVKRREIKILKIEELPIDKITDPIIKDLAGGK